MTATLEKFKPGDRVRVLAENDFNRTIWGLETEVLALLGNGKTVEIRLGDSRKWAIAAGELQLINPAPDVKEGDRVRGKDLNGNTLEGVVTNVGNKYAQLNGNSKTSVWLDSIEVLESDSPLYPHSHPEGLEDSDLPWTFIPNFLSPKHADRWLELSQEQAEWRHNDIRMFGKQIPLPRLEAIVGDGDYSYSGLTLKAQPWTEDFAALKQWIEEKSGYSFSIMIGNQYRDGSDHIGWHSDDSPEMGKRPAIASLSLGATRKFQLRNKQTKEVHSFELTHGSLFIMHPGCQEEWHHRICKASGDTGLRINWTFRPLVSIALTQPEIIDAEILPDRVEQLTQLEAQIEQGTQLCRQGEELIWIAAYRIRSEKLYEDAGYRNFEQYCLDRWGWKDSNAHEVAGAGEVFLQLKESGAPELPASVAAIRPLKKLEPEQRLEALAIAKTESGKLTADAIKRAAEKIIPHPNQERLERHRQQVESILATPIPPVREELPPSAPGRPWSLGDWVEGTDDDGRIVEGSVAAVGVGYLRLSDGTAVYEPTLLKPCDFSADAIDEPELLADSRDPVNSSNTSDELTQAQKVLLHNLKQVAQDASDRLYNDLCKLKTDADLSTLVEIAEGINEQIVEILEFHFLGGES